MFVLNFLLFFVQSSTVGIGARVLPFVFLGISLVYLVMYYLIPKLKHKFYDSFRSCCMDMCDRCTCCRYSKHVVEGLQWHSTKPSQSYADFHFADKYDAPLEQQDYEMKATQKDE